MLPVRPFCYRLALSRIPRYLIWIFVLDLQSGCTRTWARSSKSLPINKVACQASIPRRHSKSTGPDLQKFRPCITASRQTAARSNPPSYPARTHDDRVENSVTVSNQALSLPPPPAQRLNLQYGRINPLPAWNSSFGSSLAGDIAGMSGSQSTPSSLQESVQIAPGVVAEDYEPLHEPLTAHQADARQGSVASAFSKA